MIKICMICGKEFETNRPNKQICDEKHFKRCPICGNMFEVNRSTYTRMTCSKECMKKQMSLSCNSKESVSKRRHTNMIRYGAPTPAQSDVIKQKVIEQNRQKYGVDYPLSLDSVQEKRKATVREKYGCDNVLQSKEVRDKIRDTVRERYGVESNVSQSPEIRAKIESTNLHKYGVKNVLSSPEIREQIKSTNIQKYGVPFISQSKEIQSKVRETNRAKYGADWGFQSDIVQSKIAQTNLERYGTEHPAQNEDIKHKIAQTNLERYGGFTYQSPELMERVHQTCTDRYGTPYPIQSQAVQDKRMQTNIDRYGVPYTSQLPSTHRKASETRSKIITLDGTHVDSDYEKIVYDFCIQNNIPFKYQPISIEYEYKGQKHKTFIDFEIDGYLFECKGGHLMNGCFDYNYVPIDIKLDVYKKNKVIVITDSDGSSKIGKPNSTQSNGFRYTNKCPDPLIGVDIELFKDNCSFPYRDDRPHCFYDVRVDGQRSSYEAFYDLSIRWNMIKNRIEYSGGFIDAKQILNALNITRTCKQPSWFSKNLAKDIIQKYCTSDTIVDPFAGWGARADATNELHRIYIGCDFNEELVNWHHSKGRTNIVYGDANDFKYDGECSVFICPPYSDPVTGRCFEDYNFEGFNEKAKSLSQCDWMKVVMRNVLNAKEYILVCKIVDDGWYKFIVDIKKNRSHFGLNNEYILCISNADSKQLLSL